LNKITNADTVLQKSLHIFVGGFFKSYDFFKYVLKYLSFLDDYKSFGPLWRFTGKRFSWFLCQRGSSMHNDE